MEKLIYKSREINTIGFFGLGRSNIGMLSFFKRKYPYIDFVLRIDKPLSDENPHREFFKRVIIGAPAARDFYEDVVFLSPSVRRERLSVKSSNTLFSSDAEFFTEHTHSDVYAITGSDGKSTTVTLCQKLLSSVYSESFAIGNIGEAMTPFIDKGEDTAAVCEFSSFQLSYFSPHVKRALITNITKNHLDWHSSYEEYIDAKENVYRNAQGVVINADCALSSSIGSRYSIFSVYSATKDIRELALKYKSQNYVYIKDNTFFHNGKPLLNADNIVCHGYHNVINFLAATATCCDMDIKDALTATAKTFNGLKHRCQTVARINGVDFIDSSIDSSPMRTATTLSSLPDGLIIILGGKSKGLGFSELIPILFKKAKAVFLTGETGKEIYELIDSEQKRQHAPLYYAYFPDFDQAVISAATYASSGDKLILSPASTSFDRFKSFEERGTYFENLINNFHK